jgi:DNA-damage-inducible protein J
MKPGGPTMPTTNIQVRIDSALKAEAEQLFSDMGLDMPTAVRLFLKQAVINNGLPFAVERDPFYSASNQRMLRDSISQMQRGQIVQKTLSELEDMTQ